MLFVAPVVDIMNLSIEWRFGRNVSLSQLDIVVGVASAKRRYHAASSSSMGVGRSI